MPDDIDQLFSTWKQSPGPKTVTPLVKSLEPMINKALSSYGYSGDPNMKTTAQLHVIKALPRFDPSRAQLGTFVFNELKRLQRLGPKQQHAIPMPEQAAFDLKSIQRVEHDLAYNLGRDPNYDELADATGLSARRIEAIKKRYGMPTLTEQSFETDEGFIEVPGQRSVSDESQELWTEAVYQEMDPIDKKIFDWATGLHGQPRLSKTKMAAKLNISIPAITQRAQRISKKLTEGMEYNIL